MRPRQQKSILITLHWLYDSPVQIEEKDHEVFPTRVVVVANSFLSEPVTALLGNACAMPRKNTSSIYVSNNNKMAILIRKTVIKLITCPF